MFMVSLINRYMSSPIELHIQAAKSLKVFKKKKQSILGCSTEREEIETYWFT